LLGVLLASLGLHGLSTSEQFHGPARLHLPGPDSGTLQATRTALPDLRSRLLLQLLRPARAGMPVLLWRTERRPQLQLYAGAAGGANGVSVLHAAWPAGFSVE
jgi:hypothetical protein